MYGPKLYVPSSRIFYISSKSVEIISLRLQSIINQTVLLRYIYLIDRYKSNYHTINAVKNIGDGHAARSACYSVSLLILRNKFDFLMIQLI